MNNYTKNLILLSLVVLLAIAPLYLKREADFAGADGKAIDIINQIDPGYQRWFQPIWEPASSETESLIFAIQAAIGAGLLGYYFGYKKGRKKAD